MPKSRTLRQPLIEIAGVSKIFATSDGQPTWALQNVSLDVQQGEMVCVLGPSGCGKTTLLNLIAGFIDVTDGVIRLQGEAIKKPGPDRGVVFQEYALFAWLTARHNIEFARALVNEPQVLLMDEPFAAVDAMTRATLQSELLRIWQQLKLAVFFITHNVEEAIYLSQRTILMSPHPGQVQEIIPIDLPYPRERGSAEFGVLYARITAALHGQNPNVVDEETKQ
jgi:NitT/TauT family transport system ATP-binding protein